MKLAKLGMLLGTIVLGILLLVVIFISPITKYLVERYSVEYIGRQIKMERLGINIFTGSITAKELTIQEAKSKSLFFHCKQLKLNIAVYKLWAGKYDITDFSVQQPTVQIIQKGNHFNYDDLVKRFLLEEVKESKHKQSAPVQYWLRNITVQQAKLVYTNLRPFNKIEINQANIALPLVAWNDSVYRIKANFGLVTGGKCSANLVLNAQSMNYQLQATMNGLNISFLYPYLKDYLRVQSLKGMADAKIWLNGNFSKPTEIALSGDISTHDFSIVDHTHELFTAVDAMDIKIDTINTVQNKYHLSSIQIDHPFLRVSMYDKGFNYERMITSPLASSGDTSARVYANLFLMVSDYLHEIVRMYDVSNYKVNQLGITRGQCIFTDFTHGDKFRYVLDSIQLSSDRLSSVNSFLLFAVNARLNTSGKLNGLLKVNPKNYKDIDIDAAVKELLVTDFNPYSTYYTATPFINGTISYTNKTVVADGKLESKNILDVQQIRAGKKVKNSTALNLPVRLAVSLLKDVKGNIHLDIPVKGTLSDPSFKWGRVVWQVIKNLIVKAATAPFRLMANLFGGKEEEFKEIQFDYIQSTIGANQQIVLDRLANIVLQKPDLKLELIQVANITDEAEVLAVYEMKKKYLGMGSTLNTMLAKQRTDSVVNNDSLFVQYLVKQLGGSNGLQSTEEKCVQLMGRDRLIPVVQSLMQQRNTTVLEYLSKQKNIPAENLVISNAGTSSQLQKSEPPKYLVNMGVKE